MFQHLLVALDGSELSNKALKMALEIAKTHGSRLTIVTSTDPIDTGLGAGGFGMIDAGSIIQELERAYSAQAKQILDEAKAASAAAGISADTLYVPGQRAADSILATAETIGSDVIIMGSHGRRGLEKLLLGSQAAAVVARSEVPVLIVK